MSRDGQKLSTGFAEKLRNSSTEAIAKLGKGLTEGGVSSLQVYKAAHTLL